MRNFITVLFTLVSLLGAAQNENELLNNTNFNTYGNGTVTADTSVMEEEIEMDEDIKVPKRKLEKESLKEKGKDKSTPGYSSKAPGVVETIVGKGAEVPSQAPSIQSSQEFKSISYGFSSTKQKASFQRSQRSPSMEQQVQMDEAVGYFEVNSPNSFEFHYFKYVSGNYDISLIENLKTAETFRPNNADVQVQMAAYNMIKPDNDSAIAYIEKLKMAGKLTENTLCYAEDILLSVPENGVLITHGFDDYFGTWYNQIKTNMRKDVTIVSLDFLQSAHYRELLKEDGFKLPESTVIDVEFLESFCELNSSKSISISLTTPKEYFKPLQNNLFITGLVFEYHKGEFDNFHRNDKLWNSTLKKHLVVNATDEKSKQLSSNYLPMLLQLRKVYVKMDAKEKLKEVDDASDKVSVQCRKYEQVQKLKNLY
ncbi:hypothetical protein N8Z27_00755 [Crocinitomicaceae bacterium]|nr:hypothetical protein [Crocinitomicaceae bacterium]MDC1282689.1 hypothetical protein [Crocinitomicaceae bacterium]MDC1384563.1 hypothetical protein [Crocinitomicaceae bacterium]|tara:strand:- start:37758 stop:39032 length:1275 start_codon:yes stop_codon:yes gene_type:complete